MPAAAIIGGAVIGAGASVYAGNRAASAADDASRRSRDATLEMYYQGREDLAPFREAGYDSLDRIRQLFLGPPGQRAAAMRDFRTSPQYQFVREQGIEGLTNRASAGGGQLSGNALRGITSFSSGLASGEFNSYVDRLFSVAGLGGSATSQGVNAGANAGTQLANIYTNQGNARASAYGGAAAGVNSAIQGGLQNWVFNSYMNQPGQMVTPGGA